MVAQEVHVSTRWIFVFSVCVIELLMNWFRLVICVMFVVSGVAEIEFLQPMSQERIFYCLHGVDNCAFFLVVTNLINLGSIAVLIFCVSLVGVGVKLEGGVRSREEVSCAFKRSGVGED